MAIKEDLFTYLAAQPPIMALIGSRLYPRTVPTSAPLPYMRLVRTGDQQAYHLDGVSGITDSDWQLDCFAPDTVALESLTTEVRKALHAVRRGRMVGTDIHGLTIENEFDGEEIPRDSSEEDIPRTTMLVRIWYAR